MKRVWLLLLLSSQLFAGDEHGTGDYLRLLFEQGRLNAMGVIERVHLDRLPLYLQKYLKPDEYQWLHSNKQKLIQDISQSRHIWENTHPAYCNKYDTCACTENMKAGADILFAYRTCRDKAKDRQEAGSLLIHEAVHHLLGADEDRADRIATFFYVAWNSMGYSEKLECRPVSLPRTTLYRPHWNGFELVFFYSDKVGFYNPQMQTWRYETPANPLLRLERESWDTYRVFYTREAAVFSHPRNPLDGAIYHFDKNRWEAFAEAQRPKRITVPPSGILAPPPPLPDSSGEAQLVGENLLVWQNLQPQVVNPYKGTYQYFKGAPGGILHIPTNTWRPLKAHPVLDTRWGQAYGGSDKQFFVRGGFGYDAVNKKYDDLKDGFLYDLSTVEWRRMSNVGAPNYEKSRLVWGGDRLISFSPFGHTNAYYYPNTDRWTSAPSLNADQSDTALHRALPWGATWTGTDLILVGNTVHFLSTVFDRWSTRQDISLVGEKHIQYLHQVQPIWTNLELFLWDGKRLCALYL